MTKPPEFYDGDDNNAHVEFQQWRQRHQDGYFLNYKGPSNTMLHRVLCPRHLRDPWDLSEEWGHLTGIGRFAPQIPIS